MDQGIGKAFAELRVTHHLAQLDVLEYMALCPIDWGVRRGEIEGHELGEDVFEYLFPGTVVGIAVILMVGHGILVAYTTNDVLLRTDEP